MRTQTPLSLQRLSRTQVGLAITSGLVLLGVIALGVFASINANSARMAVKAGYIVTDLANVERGLYRLHLATIGTLRLPGLQFGRVKEEQARLADVLHRVLIEAADSPELVESLRGVSGLLEDYERALADLESDVTPGQFSAVKVRLVALLQRMEQASEGLYDQEEAEFFGHVERAMENQRRFQLSLLALGALLLAFAGALFLSLRRSVGLEFERAYNMLEALYRADEDLHRPLRTHSVFEALVEVVVDFLGADKSALLIRDPETDHLVLQAWRGHSPETRGLLDYASGQGLVGRTVESGRPTIIEDTGEIEDAELRKVIDAEGIGAIVHVPIRFANTVDGVLSVCYSHPRSFDQDDLRLMMALAQRAASAIRNARLYEQAEETAALEERQRLARELHDAVTQTLFSASLIAEVLPRIWEREPEQGIKRLAELQQMTRGALAEMRTLLLELRPDALAEADLGDLLRQLAEAASGRSQVSVSVEIDGSCSLVPDVKVGLYRIAQEALNNVIKHSLADCAEIAFRCDQGEIMLCVSDDGKGFSMDEIPADRLGLKIMKERAQAIDATLAVESDIEQGTKVRVYWHE